MAKYFGIQGKTALIFIVVFVIIILPVNFLIYKNVKRILVEADTQELKSEADRLMNQVRLDPQLLPLPPLGYSMYLRLTNATSSDSIFATPNFPTETLAQPMQSTEEWDTLKIVTVAKPLLYSNYQLVFSLARSNARLVAQLAELRYYLFAANLISILIAGVLVFFVSGYTLKPIRNIIAVAQNINASKSIERVPVSSSKDENHQLAITINDMLARIENSIQSQTNFFASAAHELRTPLTVMKAELTMVADQERWHDLLKEVERLERTVNDFLMISQLQSESLMLRKKPVDIHELLITALKKVRYLAEEQRSRIQINTHESVTGTSFFLDEDKLEIVIVNLLENALKYSPSSSLIRCAVFKAETLTIEVANPTSSHIINPEKFKMEFEKEDKMSAGLGMGLWIADKVVKLHNGMLSLQIVDNEFQATVSIPID